MGFFQRKIRGDQSSYWATGSSCPLPRVSKTELILSHVCLITRCGGLLRFISTQLYVSSTEALVRLGIETPPYFVAD